MLKKSVNKKESANSENIPQHIAFVCDGNRRWANARGKSASFGHRMGAAVIDDLVEHLLKRGVRTVSFYLFSIDNWKRSKEEVDFLMKFILKEMPTHVKKAHKQNLRVKFIGRKDILDKKIIKMCEKSEEQTAGNTAGTVVFALDYGGRNEILRAAQSALQSGIDANDLDMETFETFMDSGDLLPIDLVVRTGGDSRVSDFMLWKLAYAELMFIDEQWPDMSQKIIDRILSDYADRQRRFGK